MGKILIRGDYLLSIINELPLDGIYDIRSLRGGDVNDSYKVYADHGPYFLLVQKDGDINFFQGEIEGLKLFEKYGVNAPRVIDFGIIKEGAYLLLTFLEEGRPADQSKLAREVLKIHSIKSPKNKFGFEYAYRGSAISFSNDFRDRWKEVFLEERLDKLKRSLFDKKIFTEADLNRYEKIRNIISKYLDEHESEAVLVHGDLWPGNFMFDSKGEAYLFDPSPLYGDREFDLGISTVFSGFNDDFYKTYMKDLPRDKDMSLRLEFYRLYMFMLHLDKFGNIYRPNVDLSMDKIFANAKI